MKLGFKADVGAQEQESNNETKDVRTHWVLDSFPTLLLLRIIKNSMS